MPHPDPAAHSFTLRLWLEPTGTLGMEWRGRVLHVPSGSACAFREWEALLAFLTVTLAGPEPPTRSDEGPP